MNALRQLACAHCGMDFAVPVQRGTPRQYCSERCRNLAFRAKRSKDSRSLSLLAPSSVPAPSVAPNLTQRKARAATPSATKEAGRIRSKDSRSLSLLAPSSVPAPSVAPNLTQRKARAATPSATKEAGRIRFAKHYNNQFSLAQDALEQHQSANPATGIDDWCQRYFNTPFLPAWSAPKYIVDFLAVAYDAPSTVRHVSLHKGAQMGFTSALQAIVCYGVARGGKHIALAQPTAQDATEFRRDSITPLFDGIEELALLAQTVRGDQSTTSHRVYKASSVRIQGGIKPSRWRRFVADVVCIDERDAMPLSATAGQDDEGEGDIVALAMRALQNRAGRLVSGGTPTNALGQSRIVQEARDSDIALVYQVRCPCCGSLDDIAWKRMKWPETGDVAETLHHCSQCGEGWPHDRLAQAIEGGRWVESEWPDKAKFPVPKANGRYFDDGAFRDASGAETAWPRSIGFQTWSGYSPWRPWPDLVAQWLASQHNPMKLQAFVEQQLAQPWRKSSEVVEGLESKRQPVELVDGLPADCQRGIIAIDVQKDWLAVLVTAWTRPDRGWIVSRTEIHGGIIVAGEGAWLELAQWLQQWARCRKPLSVCIDVGHQQSVVLESCRQMVRRKLVPRPFQDPTSWVYCKGSSQGLDAPIFRATSTARGHRLGIVGHAIKRWQIQALDQGHIVLSDQLDDQALRELASEEIQTPRRGRPKVVQVGANESADCLSYAAAYWMARTGNSLR